MATIETLFQTADWKTEKHVPVIEAGDKAKKGEFTDITASVGKAIPHPNTTEHYISWIEVYFLPKGEKFSYQIGKFEFNSHGASTQGPNTSTVYTQPVVICSMKTDKPGIIYAISYCNIHGLWQSSKELNVE